MPDRQPLAKKVKKEKKGSLKGEKLFLGLGRDINKMISQDLDAKSLGRLACTSKAMRHNESLFKHPLEQRPLELLLEHIIKGEPDKARKILEYNPLLLLEKGTVKDYTGYIFKNRTPYQVALAVEDTQLAVEIKARLITLAGEEVAEAQGHEQFPEGWEAAEEKAWEPIFTQLKKLTQTIQHAAPADIVSSGEPDYQLTVREKSNLAYELAQFRSLLDSRLNETVTTGRQFNPQLLLAALKIYEDHFGNAWTDPRSLLFWQRVIGSIQRYLPANYIQAFCESLNVAANKLRKRWPLYRSLKFKIYDFASRRYGVSTSFYPLSASRLGVDFALHDTGMGARRLPRNMARWGRRLFEAYINQKQQTCRTFAGKKSTISKSR